MVLRERGPRVECRGPRRDQACYRSALDPHVGREQALGARVTETRDRVLSLRKGRHYQETLNHIAQLRPVVDTFFDKVMVMAEDDKLRSNRLALLATMQRSFSEIADFSEIVTEKSTGS